MDEKAILEIKKTHNNKCWHICGEVGTLYIAGWSVKLTAPLTNCMAFPIQLKLF